MLKICKNCNEEKQFTNEFFYRHKRGKNGLTQQCKECIKLKTLKWSILNKQKKQESDREYGLKNIEKIKVYQKDYREKNKESAAAYNQKYREINKDKLSEKARAYNSMPSSKKRKAEQNIERKKHDDKYRLTVSMRSAISGALKNQKGALRHVDWNIDELKIHMEKQFLKGMTWSNYGDWHIDHILPVKSFPYVSPEEINFKHCWALCNLRPLWASDNCSKQAKIENLI